ncbi:MAG: efflux RND transporter periplasmic adaptor subunit [Deltaproteobacteria bacterium]|nr:efflux RND transporter periplasmic adaptor subunit [Deltaproteobacteria bacterium]
MSRPVRLLKTLLKLGLPVAAIAVVAAYWPKQRIEVGVIHPARGEVLDVVTTVAAGTVKAKRYARVRSQTVGEVAEVFFARGARVKKGALVLRLKNSEHRARLALARANLAAGSAALRQQQTRQRQVGKVLDRTQRLYRKEVLSRANLDEAETERDVTTQAISAAEANLAQLRAAVEIARTLHDATFFRAPFDGTLASVTPEVGETLAPGSPVFELYDDTVTRIEATVDEADAARLRSGMQVHVTSDARPGVTLGGRLTWVAPMVSQDLKGSRNVEVTVELDRPDPALKVGVSADLEVVVARRAGVPSLPTSAIVGRGTGAQVLVVHQGRVAVRKVKLGLSNWDRTELLGGLEEKDEVIFTLNKVGLVPGALVVVNPRLSPSRVR